MSSELQSPDPATAGRDSGEPRPADPQEVTQLLANWSQGDPTALEKLIPLVYKELRHLAHRYMEGQRPNHTLQTTALVNEAYLRLADQSKPNFTRSEEHTSELQSHHDLVCRLLLEKKK